MFFGRKYFWYTAEFRLLRISKNEFTIHSTCGGDIWICVGNILYSGKGLYWDIQERAACIWAMHVQMFNPSALMNLILNSISSMLLYLQQFTYLIYRTTWFASELALIFSLLAWTFHRFTHAGLLLDYWMLYNQQT